MILQQERQHHIGLFPETIVLTVNSLIKTSHDKSKTNFKLNGEKPLNSRLCINCKITNHTIDKCYFLNGFYLGYKIKEDITKEQRVHIYHLFTQL